jgi:RimJ/RimL family protein N-acetyltransferase
MVTTARLRLDPLDRSHAGEMHRVWIDPAVRRYLWDGRVISIGIATDVLHESERDFEQRGFGLWGITVSDAPARVGFAGLRSRRGSDVPELMYGLLPEWWGRGLATEAGRAVLDHAFRGLALPRVDAATDAPNLASARVMQRLGMRFVRQGIVNGLDTVFYEILRDDWQSSREDPVSSDR